MATVTEAPPQAATTPDGRDLYAYGQRIVLDGISWDAYEMQLRVLNESRVRVSYNQGTMEIMSPSARHEEYSRLMGRLIETVAEELSIPCLNLKSTTWKKKLALRGLEADECFYLAHTDDVLARKKTIDLEVDPPPDLCIEIEATQSAVDRMEIYAGLRVPEVWRFDGSTLKIAVLGADGMYTEQAASPSLPQVPPSEVLRLIAMAEGLDHSRWGRRVRSWVRETLVPLAKNPRNADRPTS